MNWLYRRSRLALRRWWLRQNVLREVEADINRRLWRLEIIQARNEYLHRMKGGYP